jgi:2-polyprenyl-3-methyl-5-hydroxy-6-metoxy-1,4-benzoquinol methylase
VSGLDCIVCGGTRFAPYLDVLLKCGDCGFVTARLTEPVNAQQLYVGNYFTGAEYLDYHADEAVLKRNFRRRLRRLLRWRVGGRLLEIGSAYGFFLELAKRHFDVIGFEINREAACHGRDVCGVDICTDDFLGVDLARIGGPVDVTVMFDVIEHLERPDRFLARIAAVSNPQALLYITTGDIGSWLARWRGRKWRMIHPPTHLHYFDRRTLPQLLARYGFRVVDLRSMGVARSLRQMCYSILVLGLGMRRTYEALTRLLPASCSITLNTFDIMQVIAIRLDKA